MKEWLVARWIGILRFFGLVFICGVVATLAVAGLRYKVTPKETPMVEIYSVEVSGTAGKTVSDIYSDIGPEGPIKPYDLMCAAHQLKGQGYGYTNVLFPAWFHAPGGMVSDETVCSLDGNSLRKKFPNYREIGS
jgi:hypothetical protein